MEKYVPGCRFVFCYGAGNVVSLLFPSTLFAGCCFITYYTRKSALEAQNALHNMKILPGVSRL